MSNNKPESKSFFSTLPGILTAVAGLITALAALIGALNAAGIVQIFVPAKTSTPTVVAIQSTPTTQVTLPLPTAIVIVVTATPPPNRPTDSPVPPTQVVVPTTAVPPATRTPTPNLEQVVDSFEGINNTFVQDNFKINRNAGNDLTLRLVGVPHVSQGAQALEFAYNLRNAPPQDYVGFDRTLAIADWSKYSRFCAWVESDGSNRTLVIQFGENNNSFVKSTFALSNRGGSDYCMPISGQSSINLRAIGYYGIYVQGTPQGSGVIYIDNIRLVP